MDSCDAARQFTTRYPRRVSVPTGKVSQLSPLTTRGYFSGMAIYGSANPLLMAKTITFDTVQEIALSLPGVQKGSAYGVPALKVHGQILACIPANASAEPGSIMVRVGFEDRAELLAGDPAAYYVTDHYVNYSGVLVRLSNVDRSMLRDLLGMAYKFVTRQRQHTPRRTKRR